MASRNYFRYKLGMVLLAINYPVGYGGLWFCGIMFLRTKMPAWLAAAGGCYLVSWVMLAGGFFLAGQEGVRRMRFFWRRTKRRLQFIKLKEKE
ncbi:MAG: hypothetical protein ABIA75_13565 [Candidatus Neomarinimicrobiota bacterium]